MRSASHGGTRPPCNGKSAIPDLFMRVYLATDYTDLAISFANAPDVESSSKDHSEQKENRDEHDEIIP